MGKDEVLDQAVRAAHTAGQSACGQGRVADYIPELAKVDPDLCAVSVATVDGRTAQAGACDHRFTLQSASKVFALGCALRSRGSALFDHVSVEPSGDAFFSIVKLEEEHGHPRNPYINAGAILVSAQLPGETVEAKSATLRGYIAEAAGCPDEQFAVDEDVFRSELQTGYRNRALSNIMRHHHVIEDEEAAATAYFRQCAITITAPLLARAGLHLANRGVDPVTGRTVLSRDHCRRVVALMATCGMYDEVGRHAIDVGLPTKSAVSGAMLAVVPGWGAIATFGPALGRKGNSVAGKAALAHLAASLDLSLYE